MSKPQFDPSKFSVTLGTLYYDGKKATSYRIKQYNRYVKGNTRARISSVSQQYGKYFGSQTKFTGKGGSLQSWARPLSLKGGPNSNYNWSRGQYRGINGVIRSTSSTSKFGANINSNAAATVFVGTRQWVTHLRITLHALYTSAENFRVLVGNRAIKVFQNSFRYRRFYSNRTQNWRGLSDYTLRKRAHRGTGSRILYEYGDLHNSFKLKERVNMMTTRVYTDVVPANAAKHKKHSICYAGYHNEGKGTYGKGWNGTKPKPYIRRQFMGHSSHLDPYKDSFMRKMMKIYLFDSVFLAKK